MASKKKSSNLISAGIVLAALGIGGIGYYLFSDRERSGIVQQTSIWEASHLGNMPLSHSYERGKPIVFIGQQHPNQALQVGALTTHNATNKTNIAEVAQAAFEAYDKYGIRALFVESAFQSTVDDYNKNKRIRVVPSHAQDTHAPVLEHILNSREWTLYADSSEDYADLQRIAGPIKKEVQGYVQKMFDAINRKESIDKINDLRVKYQKEIDNMITRSLGALIATMYTNREKTIIRIAKEALEKENGIVVIYGYFHAKGVQYQAKQDNVPLLFALNKRHSKLVDEYSIEQLIRQRFELPKVEYAK